MLQASGVLPIVLTSLIGHIIIYYINHQQNGSHYVPYRPSLKRRVQLWRRRLKAYAFPEENSRQPLHAPQKWVTFTTGSSPAFRRSNNLFVRSCPSISGHRCIGTTSFTTYLQPVFRVAATTFCGMFQKLCQTRIRRRRKKYYNPFPYAVSMHRSIQRTRARRAALLFTTMYVCAATATKSRTAAYQPRSGTYYDVRRLYTQSTEMSTDVRNREPLVFDTDSFITEHSSFFLCPTG